RQGSRQRPHLPGVEADELGELADALAAAVAGPTLVEPEDLVDGRLHRLTWVEARVRVLEHDLDLLAPASPVAGGARGSRAVTPAGSDGARSRPLQADDHLGHSSLARARLAHDRQRAALRQRERDVVHRDLRAEDLAQAL